MSRFHVLNKAAYKTPVGTPEDWDEFCESDSYLSCMSLPIRVIPLWSMAWDGREDPPAKPRRKDRRQRRARYVAPPVATIKTVEQPLSFWAQMPDWEVEFIAQSLLDRATTLGFDARIWLDAYMKARCST